jgi:hypothetical protein
VQFLGVARVDDPEAMSKRLAEDVTNKAFKLLVTVRHLDDKRETMKYECQVNLIREGTSIIRPVTAKHNISNGEVDGVVEQFQMAELRILKPGIQKDIDLEFPDDGCTYTNHI